MMRSARMILISAGVLFILVCTGCGENVQDALSSGMGNALSTILSTIVIDAAEAALGI
jgi:type III secretory pathway lipoprotein EscJ